jgi:hypothetical protein
MKRQIIKTRMQRPYVIARIVIAVVSVGVLLIAAYEIVSRAGLHFH